jgi:eukaryotic-like serine/threonine-protein kinase
VTLHVPIPEALLAGSALVAGRYRLDRILGMGGMGYVVSGIRIDGSGPVERVAIKFMLPAAMLSESLHRRFVREAEAIGRLRSEHVCRLLETGTTPEGAPYMVMEYLSGDDLEGLVSRRGPLPVWEAADFGLQVLDAIAEAHSQGIIHRDLKPANVFRAWGADDLPVVKVLDFGVAKAADGMYSTATNTVMGSPAFMAPEQIVSSKRVDERADIYSIGAILYFLLTGKPPFDADQLPALCLKVLSEDPVPPSQLRFDVPAEVDDIVLTCMAREPAHRFPNAAELASALAPFAPDERRPLAEAAARALAWTPGTWLRPPRIGTLGMSTVRERRPDLSSDLVPTQLVRPPTGDSGERRRSLRRRIGLAALSAIASLGLGFGVAALVARSESPGAPSASRAPVEPAPVEVEPAPVEVEPAPVEVEPAPVEVEERAAAPSEGEAQPELSRSRQRRAARRRAGSRPAQGREAATDPAPPAESEPERPRCELDDPLCAFGTAR